MNRYAFRIEYHGADYAGWQRQDGQISVQEVFERALSCLEPIGIAGTVAAGRTDSGVHARGQVAHCNLSRHWEPLRLREALNAHLRAERVRVLDVACVGGDFSARHSAVERVYVYRILSRRPPPAIEDGLVWHVRHDLNVDSMRRGAKHLVGRHDFTTFRSVHCQAKSPVRTLDSLVVERQPRTHGVEIVITARARSFLHRQIRSLVGSLERVGAGLIEPHAIAEMLAARDRSACGPVAPARGLYLTAIKYQPDPFQANG